ncbi:MAG: glycosyltransferase family 9 protein [Candidatus Omnitrophota bacterium]
MDKQKKILIFELNWLGDILFSFPFLRALKERDKESHIACAVVPRYAGLLSENPFVDEVYLLSDRRGFFSFFEKLFFVLKIKKEKYDTCFFLKSSNSKGMMAVSAGIHDLIGFKGKKTKLTTEVDDVGVNVHRAERIFALAEAVGIKGTGIKYEYSVSEKNIKKADEIIKNKRNSGNYLIGIHPGGNWDEKRWDKEKFVGLIKRILENLNDADIIITGGKKDKDLARYISDRVKDERCYTLAGETSLEELAGLFKKCRVIVSADSGPLHLASAVGACTIGLFGPTSYKITGQIGRGKNVFISSEDKIECRVPCYTENCVLGKKCMDLITVDEVFEAVAREVNGEKLRGHRQ